MAFYKFVTIDDPHALQASLLAFCEERGFRGTILLGREGINGTLAAPSPEAATAFLEHMRQDARFADIDFKPSGSEKVPFHRMHVKVKREIVTMGKEGIEPAHFTGKYVEPLELKEWLDNGEDILLVDTRNDYEVRLGTFKGALDPNIKTFRTFPQWVEETLSDKKDKRIVTFCTGGIRCEKATAYMRQQGFEDVWQLHGGILKYFEDVARTTALKAPSSPTQNETHYHGHCFVFDYRVAVDQTLAPSSEHALCYACRAPLSPEDLTSPLYIYEQQCPYCAEQVRARAEAKAKRIALRRAQAQARRKERREQARTLRRQGGTTQLAPLTAVPAGHVQVEP